MGVAGGAGKMMFGDQAAELQRQAGLERARRANLQNMQTLGQGTAAAGSSGFAFDTSGRGGAPQSSMANYLQAMTAEFAKQNQYALEMANRGADLAKMAGGFGGMADFGSSVFQYSAANKWFQGQQIA